MSLFAQYERHKTAQHMAAGKRYRAKQGKPKAGFVPLGYAYHADAPGVPAHWSIVEEESAIVRRIYEICLSGIGIWPIARQLTRERIPTKMDSSLTHRREKLSAVGASAPSSVSKILYNCNYVAIFQ
jgi:site-specific DNA recombinase